MISSENMIGVGDFGLSVPDSFPLTGDQQKELSDIVQPFLDCHSTNRKSDG